MNSQKGSAVIIIIFITLFILVGAGGYFLGSKNIQLDSQVGQNGVKTTNEVSVNTNPESSSVEIENEFWQEFSNGETFSFRYPVDNNTSVSVINGKDSGWPISPLEQTFITGVSVVKGDYGEVRIGHSDTDPTVCLNSVCHEGGLESISKIETATISGILSKKVTGTAYPGGGVLPPGELPPITVYVIPYKENFFIISGSPEGFLNHIKNSFKVSGN